MKIDSISYLTPKIANESTEHPSSVNNNFGHWITEQVMNTNNQLNQADAALHQLATGQSIPLHQTMIALEQAKLSFQYLEQIRNRLMSAYQELLREQI